MAYRDLEVYKRAYQLALEIHKLSFTLKIRDLSDQIRRASRSIPSNIAEAYGRDKSVNDIVNGLRTALGSNDEMLFNIEFMKDTELITQNQYQKLYDEYTICGKQLHKLIEAVKNQQTRN